MRTTAASVGLPNSRSPYACSDEVVLVGPRRGGRSARDADFVEDVADVARDGFLADEQRFRDVAVRLACRDQPQDLRLSFAEGTSGPWRRALQLLCDARKVWLCVELRKQR